ncbi:unnamed protein product [Didymodactylos carnosus]|uniref:Uncharacterized protein n=2 Tax=Didymodactylos carnosus TaxID=1234261 RepID=A0A8S2Q4B5_9BILA|nr:unnamed protein product [Didymodactylos carnosus]CAF4080303.1 unnamed protein product [Didymodactylos carnosus]
MIPEYLNHIEAALYLWSAVWYIKEDTIDDYYTLAVHKIEIVAAFVELVASFGWLAVCFAIVGDTHIDALNK